VSPQKERLLKKLNQSSELKEKKRCGERKSSSNLSSFAFSGFCCVEIFEVATEKNFTAT